MPKVPKGCTRGFCHFWHLITLGFSRNTRPHAQHIALPEACVVAFQYGFDAWPEVIVAERIEPTVDTHEGGSDTRWGAGVAPWHLEEAEEATREE